MSATDPAQSVGASSDTRALPNGAVSADVIVALLLTLGSGYLYWRTMPPAVLDGDPGRWQYVCHTLGVSYPTGAPLLTLLGKAWTLLVPIGSMAYRINLMSVVFGAVFVGLTYLFLRKLVADRSAAVLGAMLFATLPTTWWWSVTIKTYALNLVFVNTAFLLLFRWSETRGESTLRWFAVAYGLSLTNHSTMLLLAPAFAAFILLTDGSILRSPRRLGILVVLMGLSFLITYTYIPIRGAMLWMSQSVESGLPWPVSVSRGLVSSEYYPSVRGFLNFLLATDYTQSLVSSWADVPRQLLTVYGDLVSREFGWAYVALGAIGCFWLLVRDFKKGVPVLLAYLAFPPMVVQYGQGTQAAFLLPSNLMLVAGIASAIAGVFRILRTVARKSQAGTSWRWAESAARLLVIAVFAFLIVVGAAARYPKMDRSQDYAVQNYWKRILRHPLEQNAGVLAHSGVLVPMWYFQLIEGERPDLFGLFPPDDQIVRRWLEAGHALYLAGPLEGWLPQAEEHYRLTPWGILVKIALPDSPDELDMVAPQRRTEVDFSGRLELIGYDLPGMAPSGEALPLRLYWRTTNRCAVDYLVSLRLVDASGRNVSVIEDRLVSAWYPARDIPVGRLVLGVYDLSAPIGLLPGDYEVRLAVHNPDTGESLSPAGQPAPSLLGRITVGEPVHPVASTYGLKHTADVLFGNTLRLIGYSVFPDVVTVGQGVSIEMLWQAEESPPDDLEFRVQWLDADGVVRKQSVVPPAQQRYPLSRWKADAFVRDWLVVNTPAELPGGRYSLRLGLSAADGRLLGWRHGWLPLPADEWFQLAAIEVMDRPRQFHAPSFVFSVGRRFADRIELLGFDLDPARLEPHESLALTLYWKALRSMETSYTVFVHLVDPQGHIRTQQDGVPAGGTLPTTGWVGGEIITDRHELRIDSGWPPGQYGLLVGLYDASTGLRLPVVPGNDDHVRLISLDYAAPDSP